MRVVTKLVKTDFFIDKIYVDEQGHLVMENSEDEKMRVRVYMDASDVVAAVKKGLSLDVIKFVAKATLRRGATRAPQCPPTKTDPSKYLTGGNPKP